MESVFEIIILVVVIGFIINKKKPEWIDWIKSKLTK